MAHVFGDEDAPHGVFVLLKEALLGVGGEPDAAVFGRREVFRQQDLHVKEHEDEPIHDGGAEFLHEVESEATPPILGRVKEAEIGIEADGGDDGYGLAEQERIPE
jgi:hypothetical protein